MFDVLLRMTGGVERLPEELRARHAGYLADLQNADGGFPGRQGLSDPYYTAFGLGGLALLGQLDETRAQRAAAFVAARLADPTPPASIDFLALVIASMLVETLTGTDLFAAAGRERQQAVSDFFAPLRRPDGGYAKTARGGQGSTYHTFLVVTGRQLVGVPADEPERLLDFVRSRRRADGGYVELSPLRASGVNPTAAAIGLLQAAGRLDEAADAAAFLATMQTPDGGLRANTQIPVADLLSTFTGLVALVMAGGLERIDLAGVRRFAESLELSGGGFRAGPWDNAADAEYTFYGLGVLGVSSTWKSAFPLRE